MSYVDDDDFDLMRMYELTDCSVTQASWIRICGSCSRRSLVAL